METTAEFREAAIRCEAALRFVLAASYWDAAADVYPEGSGELRERDIQNLRARAAQCRADAKATDAAVAS